MTKRIGVAMEFPRSSKRALKWAFENLACRGDVLYLILVNPTPDNELRRFRREQGRDIHLEISLEELRDPDIMRRHDIPSDMPMEYLDILETYSRQKEVTAVVPMYWGDARQWVSHAIYDCDLVGRGMVFNFVTTYAGCPVTIVK